ncbi:MAG: pilin [Candidatus Paceibacterota bacterium]
MNTPDNFKELVQDTFIEGILNPIVPFLIGLAVVMFIYGVLLFMFNDGGEKREEGKQYMIWGIVGIFVMVSVWGLVAILTGTFQLNNSVPTIQMNVPNL